MSGLRAPEPAYGEWSLRVSGVVSQGGSDAVGACEAECADAEVAPRPAPVRQALDLSHTASTRLGALPGPTLTCLAGTGPDAPAWEMRSVRA